MINPELLPFRKDWADAWARLPAGSGAAARWAHFEVVAQERRQPTPEAVATEVFQIEVPDTSRRVRVRAFRPGTAGPHAALVYLHGGAWMQGSPETHWDITAALAHDTGRAVFSVDCAKLPEMPLPAAVDDVRAVIAWLFARTATLGVDAKAIAIGGDSAGANLAAAMTLVVRDTACALQGQLLGYPACDFNMDRPSYRDNADGPIVTTASMPGVNAMYCPNPADLLNPLAAPLHAASHTGLPPCFLAVAEHGLLRRHPQRLCPHGRLAAGAEGLKARR